MEKAIKIAIENGYGYHTSYKSQMSEGTWKKQVEIVARGLSKEKNELLLDPLFWQALTKGLGMEKKTVVRRAMVMGHFAIPAEGLMYKEIDFGMDYIHEWHFRMHLCIDHLAEGKDIESFFENLWQD